MDQYYVASNFSRGQRRKMRQRGELPKGLTVEEVERLSSEERRLYDLRMKNATVGEAFLSGGGSSGSSASCHATENAVEMSYKLGKVVAGGRLSLVQKDIHPVLIKGFSQMARGYRGFIFHSITLEYTDATFTPGTIVLALNPTRLGVRPGAEEELEEMERCVAGALNADDPLRLERTFTDLGDKKVRSLRSLASGFTAYALTKAVEEPMVVGSLKATVVVEFVDPVVDEGQQVESEEEILAYTDLSPKLEQAPSLVSRLFKLTM
jgi:hypothetical protein